MSIIEMLDCLYYHCIYSCDRFNVIPYDDDYSMCCKMYDLAVDMILSGKC